MKYLFSGCSSLESLDLSYFNTSLVNDIQGMFKNCESINSLDLSNFNTNLVINMEFLFSGCRSLLSLNLYNFNTSLVENMKQMFSHCTSLITLNIFNFDTKLVNNMQFMFTNCSSLKSLDLSNFDTSKVTDMQNMFSYCTSLEDLNISNFKISSVENMKNMFYYCSSLKFLDLSNFEKSLNTNLNYMLGNCVSLKSLNLSNFDTSLVTSMEKMFYNCYEITSLNLSSFNTSLVNNMKNMFENCKSLLYLNFQNFIMNSSLDYSNIFKNIKENIVYCINDDINFGINNSIIESLLSSKKCSIKDCLNNWEESIENKFNEKKKDISIFYDKCFYFRIKDISEDFFILNNISIASIYSYKIDSNINILKDKYKNLTFIDFTSNNIVSLKSKFNLSNDDNIYLLIYDIPSNDPLTATSDYDFKLILENGTELNLSLIEEDYYVDIAVPIRNLSLSHFNYATYFSEQGYDIYNKSDSFYNDLCSSAYYNKNDLTIKDRKIYIYPNNITLCKNSCDYKMANLEDQRITCECNLYIYKNYYNNISNIENEDKDFLSEDNDEEDESFLNILLDNINYKIFKCEHLLYSFNNYIDNIGFYLIAFSFVITIFFNAKFCFFGMPNIRINMFKESPDKGKIKNKIKNEKLNKRKRHKTLTVKNNPSKKKFFIKDKKKIFITNPQEQEKNKMLKSLATEHLNIFNIKKIQNLDKTSIKNYVEKLRKQNYFKNRDKKDKENYNDLPFTKAIIEDNRNFLKIFISIFIEKVELINLFMTDSKIKDILIIEYILSLLIDFFFNTLFYSDNVVSHKFHNNGRLDFVITLLISITSNIITSIIIYFLNYSKWMEEKLEMISEIKNEYKYLFFINRFFKIIKFKLICLLIYELIIIIICFYYITIFCSIYSRTQISLLFNYIASLLEGFLKTIIVTIIVAITRKIGISFLNIYSYNTSKYIFSNF